MPTSQEILAALTALAQQWQALAIAWHVYVVALAAALTAGWRPQAKVVALLILAPVASAAALAAMSGNPFNAVVLGAVVVVAAVIALRWPARPLTLATRGTVIGGGLLVGFGLAYPHFLDPPSTLVYLYAAPTGIVPCPTLSVAVGLSLACGTFGSRAWGLTLGAAGVFYGLFGALRLGVNLDWVLLVGAILLLGAAIGRRGAGGQKA